MDERSNESKSINELPKVVNFTATVVKKRTILRKRSKHLDEDLNDVELPLMTDGTKKRVYVACSNSEEESSKVTGSIVKNKKNFSIKKIVSFLGVLVMIAVAVYCTSVISLWGYENDSNAEQLSDIKDLVVEKVVKTENTGELEDTKVLNQVSKDEENSSQLAFVDVDFRKLKDVNDETLAYIKMNNLDVDAPVVQTFDNSFYLTHSFDKSKNSAGWIFGDYRNDWDDLKANTIIYGHNRKNYAMFGSLKKVFERKWYENEENHKIYISTESKNMVFQIFSAYTIPTETYYLKNEFESVKEHEEFLDTLTSRSRIDFGIRPTVNDKILTLSTCHTSDAKTVIHAMLIDVQEKDY